MGYHSKLRIVKHVDQVVTSSAVLGVGVRLSSLDAGRIVSVSCSGAHRIHINVILANFDPSAFALSLFPAFVLGRACLHGIFLHLAFIDVEQFSSFSNLPFGI